MTQLVEILLHARPEYAYCTYPMSWLLMKLAMKGDGASTTMISMIVNCNNLFLTHKGLRLVLEGLVSQCMRVCANRKSQFPAYRQGNGGTVV